MSEFFNVSLLGIIGTATGIAALLISYRTYSKQKPNLKIKVTKCVHDFPNPVREPQAKDINFWTNFQIKNVGDRGTRIENIVLSFTINAKNYHVKETNRLSELSEITRFQLQTSQNGNRWIKAHDTVDIGSHFNISYTGTEESNIECVFDVYDTHRKHTVQGISTKVDRPPLQLRPFKKSK
jgi:hypothetical protein